MMDTILNPPIDILYEIRRRRLSVVRLVWMTVLVFVLRAFSQAPVRTEIQRTLIVSPREPVVLDIEIAKADLEVLYNRDGQVSITGFAQETGDGSLDDKYFSTVLTVEQNGNHLKIRHVSNEAYPEGKIKVLYRIDVPYRTEVTSRLNQGKQTIRGILGPVTAVTARGDIVASYVSGALQAQAESGNLSFEVIGEHVNARTGSGNIAAERLAHGITAETGDGDISLAVVGPSTAIVAKGNGRIEVGGARDTLSGTTDGGDLHVTAVPHSDWKLNSRSGTIRLDLPPAARFEFDASTDSGRVQADRDDIPKPADLHQVCEKVNGGGKRIVAHTESGKIIIR